MKPPETLISMIERFPEYGEKPAILALQKEGVERWTYSRLSQECRRLAAGLKQEGVGLGDRVVIQAAAKPDWVVTCLAVILAGGVVVPLDTQLEDRILSRILNDCGARIVFTDAGRIERMERIYTEAGCKIFLFNAGSENERSRLRPAIDFLDDEPDFPAVAPKDTAALFYTSGTTGPPKGVPLTHRNLTFQYHALIEARLIGENDRMLLPLPLHHVYPFVIGMLCPLVFGIPIVMPRSQTGPEILKAVKTQEATMIIGVPRLYSAFYEGIESKFRSRGKAAAALFKTAVALSKGLRRRMGISVGKRLLKPIHDQIGPDLRVMASGGSPLDPELAWNLEGLGWQVAIGYGLTETSPLLTLNPPGRARIGSVGRPIAGVDIRIDFSAIPESERKKEDPVRSGEILAKGPNVFSGYDHLPERTKERFTEDGWFRTGDLGYFDPSGYLYVAGRVDTMIVTESGENIQPEDLESSYAQSPLIREIGILQKNRRIAAVVVPEWRQIRKRGDEDIHGLIRQEIEAHSKKLPTYQRISDFVLSREPLSRTRLGKIQRHLLSERYDREKQGVGSGQRKTEPISAEAMSPGDRALLEDPAAEKVWNWLVRRYPRHPLTPDSDPQLDLGIDSMGWLNLTMELLQQTGIELSEETIVRIETVRDLLREVIEASDRGKPGRLKASLFEDPESFISGDQKKWLKPLGPRWIAAARKAYLLDRLLLKRAFRLKVYGREHLPVDKPFVLAPNHISYLDALALAAALDFSTFRKTYWGGWRGAAFANPILRFFSRLAQAVPIDPEKGAVSSLAFGAAVLKRGKNLVWFPEGQRSPSGELQPFKTGIGVLLSHFPVAVVPVLIRGTDKAMPPGSFIRRLHPVTLVFGSPRDPKGLKRQGEGKRPEDRITRALRDAVAEMGRIR
ncbi:MAG: AMP-dependent synthetase [Desulfobacteraceae bacterium]|nr:MAG: AMP-dependent synthetase [Desulfobacteraceae bacterium]